MAIEYQRTLARAVCVSGQGLHSGLNCELRALPAGADYGIRFARVDLQRAPEIILGVEAVSKEPLLRQTILCAHEAPNVSVQTTEHLLAAFHALGIDNARVEMTAPEAPIGDGSASQITEALIGAGTVGLGHRARRLLRVARPIAFMPEDDPSVEYAAWPSEGLRVTYFLEQDHPFIGSQSASFLVDPETFVRELAPARTFCTFEEVELLRSKGLIKGGSAENAIVIGRQGILNTELKWDNELARHKLLDLIGDLLLAGLPVRGHILAYRGGHHTNGQFIKHLRREFT